MIGGKEPIDVDATQSLAKADPKTKTLVVASFPPASKPTCDWLATPTKAGKTGNVTFLYATGPKLAPGFFDVPTGESIDLATGAKNVGAVGGEMAVSKLDDKSLAASVHNKYGGSTPSFIVGDIVATMCPPGAIAIPKATSTAAGGKKSGGKGGKKH